MFNRASRGTRDRHRVRHHLSETLGLLGHSCRIGDQAFYQARLPVQVLPVQVGR